MREQTSQKNIILNKTFNKDKFEYLIHCGSISEYSLSELKLKKLGKFCENNKKYKVLFTSSQVYVPDYFKRKLEEYSNYFIYNEKINFIIPPSRIFRKLTILNTILKIRTRQMAEKGVEFS